MRNKIFVVIIGIAALVAASLGYHKYSGRDADPSDLNADGEVTLQDVSIVMSAMAGSSSVIIEGQ